MSFQRVWDMIIALVTTWGLRVVGVLVALFVAWLVAGWVRRRMLAAFQRRKYDPTLGSFFANAVRYAILIGAVIGCLGVFGIQTASFAAVIAAAGLAVGLAFQGTLSNFAAGVMLITFRPFKVGDLVNVGGVLGVVSEVDLFTTRIDTLDNRALIVPNAKIVGEVIENLTYHDKRRVDVPVGTDYGADLDQVRSVLEKAISSVDGVLDDPAPQVFLKQLGASSIDWELRAWCRKEDYWNVYQGLVRAAKQHLDAAGIGIPFPQMDVHLDAPAQASATR